jgi:phospholipase A-2-activating protein
MSHLDQVVQFIEKNTAGVTLGVNNDFVDPFTGEFTSAFFYFS